VLHDVYVLTMHSAVYAVPWCQSVPAVVLKRLNALSWFWHRSCILL